MDILHYKIVAVQVILGVSILAVIYPLRSYAVNPSNKFLELGEAFASGIFLGVALFHMLPLAHETFAELWPKLHYPLTELLCSIGFLLLLLLERCAMYGTHCERSSAIPYLFALMLSIHSLLEGLVLGLNPNMAAVIIMCVAIVAHKGSASFALCVTLLQHKFALMRVLVIVLLFALVTPIGIGLGMLFNSMAYLPGSSIITACFNAIATGSFLYMATLHHVQFHQRTSDCWQGWIEFVLLALGLLLMAVIAVWI